MIIIKKNTKIPIIMGGIHPTVKPEECLEYADYVCVGEAEEAFPEFVEKLEKGKRMDNIKNIWTKKGNKIIKNTSRPPIKDLDILPIPCFEYSKLFEWHNNKIKSLEKNPEVRRIFFDYWYSIMTSRGCPFKCKYCVNDALGNMNHIFRMMRRRSDEKIIEELKIAKKKIGKFIVNFVDDDFIIRPIDSLKQFLIKYKKEINLPLLCAGTPTALTDEKIKLLIDAGAQRIQIGIQSFSEKVNKEIYGRYTSSKQLIDMIERISKYRHKILFVFDIILDTPWEKDDTRIETLKFLLTFKKPYEIWLNSMTLYPGTSLYERAKKEGIIKNEKEEIYNKSFYSLENTYVNSLFLLFVKFNFPKSLIRKLIKYQKYKLIERPLKNSTYLLLHLDFYIQGFRNIFKFKKYNLLINFLSAPARLIVNKLEGRKRTGV